MRRVRSPEPEERRVRPRLRSPLRRRRSIEEPTRNVRRRANALPRYESRNDYVDGNLHTVTLKPIYSGGENASTLLTRELIANSIKFKVVQGLRASGIRGTRRELEQRVSGVLTARNMEGPDRSVGQRVRLEDLNEQTIENIFGMITQSNEDMEIYQVQWVFIIPPGYYINKISFDVDHQTKLLNPSGGKAMIKVGNLIATNTDLLLVQLFHYVFLPMVLKRFSATTKPAHTN